MRPLPTLCCVLAFAAVHAGEPQPASYAPMIEAVAPAVVTIYTTRQAPQRMGFPGGDGESDPQDPFSFFFGPRGGGPRMRMGPAPKQMGQGSGMIVQADGTILTNNHVIEGADSIEVQLRGEQDRIKAKLVGADPKTDVAVLRIEPKGRSLRLIAFADSDKVRVGDLAFAIGNPFGVGHSVSMGIVSATGRGDVHITDYEDFIQTDASINPGNSGGALVDSLGRLIGMNTAIYSRGGGNIGIGFAVPANLAKRVMDQIVGSGKVVRGYLGVQITPVDAALARKFKLPNEHGAMVGEVVESGPAGKAGVAAGDVIVRLDGTEIADPRQLRMLVAGMKPGATVKLTVVRDGAERAIEVVLGELPDAKVAAGDGEAAADPDATIGVALKDLDPQSRQQAGVPRKLEGALIAEVKDGSRADRAGLRPGMVITEVERRAVADASAAVQQLRSAKGEVLLRVFAEGGQRWVVVPAE